MRPLPSKLGVHEVQDSSGKNIYLSYHAGCPWVTRRPSAWQFSRELSNFLAVTYALKTPLDKTYIWSFATISQDKMLTPRSKVSVNHK